MDGFTGFKSAAAEELPGATTVMDPFHVVHLAGNALDECRRRIQQELHHRRGRATDPLYKARRMLHTRSCLLTARQQHQILDLFSSDEHVALEVTWSAYQNIIDAYRSSNARGGKTLMHEEIARLTSTSVPSSLTELITLGRTLKRRATDILAYFDHPHTSNGPTEAINAPPRTPTRLRPRTSETSPTTSPAASSKPEDSNPNYTPNYEEPRIRVPAPPRHPHAGARALSACRPHFRDRRRHSHLPHLLILRRPRRHTRRGHSAGRCGVVPGSVVRDGRKICRIDDDYRCSQTVTNLLRQLLVLESTDRR